MKHSKDCACWQTPMPCTCGAEDNLLKMFQENNREFGSKPEDTDLLLTKEEILEALNEVDKNFQKEVYASDKRISKAQLNKIQPVLASKNEDIRRWRELACALSEKVKLQQARINMLEGDIKSQRERIKELISAYDEYIKLLGDELDAVTGLALAHGWKSTRYDAGVKCREKIQSLKGEA
jgi:hypothetical protein